jgi:WD40 repeat protein
MKTTEVQLANPFPGLRPFRSDEHHLFFGREEQTAALLQLLRTNRFLAVVGTSGSGKSSLVRAGLIAELHGGTMTRAGSTWEVVILRPGGSPIENLARAMVEAGLYDAEDAGTLPRLLATLNRSRFGLVEAMKQSELFEAGTNLLVVVDQFEELFRFRQQGVDSEETAAAFVTMLLTASEQAECPIYVTITMRSDYLGDCSEIPGLAEAVNEGEYLIPRLLRDQKRDAVEKPIGVGGAKISPLLVQRLLNDVGDDPDQLPVLQHALMRMWDVWAKKGSDPLASRGLTPFSPNRPIDFGDFEATGGLGAALSNHADEIYDSLPDERHRSACAKVFKALTQKGDDNRGIRRPTRLAQLQTIAAADRATVTTVLDAFRGAGVTFLMPGAEVELGDRTVIDLSHESLMRGWQRLRGWVEDEAQSARVFRRLLDTARLWGDGKAGLYRDPDLQIALSWREQEAPNTEWAGQYGGHFETAIGFLEASSAEAQAERQAREAARQHELDQARQLAEAQRLRLEQQRRAARRLRAMIAGLAAVALLAGLACASALIANQRANVLAAIARQNEEEANQHARRAEQSQRETANALTVAEAQKAKAEAAEEAGRKLLYTTDMRLAPFVWRDGRITAKQLRVLLVKHVPDSAAAAAKPDLRGFEWHYHQHLLEHSAAIFSGHDVAVVDSAFTPDGQLVTLDQNGRVRRWDLASQDEDAARRRDLPGGRSARIRVLSPNTRLVALAEGKKVHLYDTSTGKETCSNDSARYLQRVIFSGDGDKLVTVGDEIRWCNASTGEVIASVARSFEVGRSLTLSADGLTLALVGQRTYGREFSSFRLDATTRKVTPQASNVDGGETLGTAALSPDGQRIAIGWMLYGVVSVFDTATGRPIAKHGSAHGSPIRAVAFAGDGAKLATADAEGTIKIWADARKLTSNSTPLRTLKGHEGAINSVRFSIDGKRLVSTGADKTVRVWDLEDTGAAIRPLERSEPLCWVARFSPDGHLIAAAAAESGRVRLWDAATGRLVRELSAGGKSRIRSVAFSPTDNRLLAVGHGGPADGSYVALWDIDAGTELARLPGATNLPGIPYQVDESTGAVGALAFSPDGKYLVAGFGNKNLLAPGGPAMPLKVWDVAARRLIHLLNGHTSHCLSLDFSRDGKLLASGGRDGTAILWSTEKWNKAQTLRNPDKETLYKQQGRGGMVEDVAFSPNGKTLAMASYTGNVHLWDVASGKVLDPLEGHSSAVTAVAFSPDGRTLASGSVDQTVRLWNVATRNELLQLDTGGFELGPLLTLAFSPDGKRLLAGGEVGTAFWSTAPIVWNDAGRAAAKLRLLLKSNADFQSRIRMLSENLRLYAALEKLDRKDVRVRAALAATRANWRASRRAWPEAVAEIDRLVAADPTMPEAWLRTPGLLRLATALLHQNRPDLAAPLLHGGAKRRAQDGLPAIAKGKRAEDATGDLFFPLLAAVEKRLAKDARDAGLLELRAELAGQESDFVRQVTDYTAAIKILAEQPAEAVAARLRRLYRCRGDAYVRLQKWPEAVDDYGHVITPKTTDALLLANRARALEALKKWDAAAADWSRAATGSPEGARLLAEFARRLVAGNQVALANAQYAKTQPLYERLFEAAPESDSVAAELAQVLLEKNAARWTILEPAEMKSEGGATLTPQDDHSILAGGKNPPKDVYTLTFRDLPARIQTLRLEVLPHASLPRNGPGRGGNGNFVLTTVKVQLELPMQSGEPRDLKLVKAAADHDQPGDFGVAGAIDENDYTGWACFSPQPGKPHLAVFELAKAFVPTDGAVLRVSLEFKSNYKQYQLGRFRLSVSGDPATLEREEKRFAAMKLVDPWPRLAAAYRFAGNQQALGKLVARYPEAGGDLYAADQDWGRAVAEYRRAVTARPADGALLIKLANAYQSAGRTREAVPHLAKASAVNPDDIRLASMVGALQAWFGQDKELAETCERALAFARGTSDPHKVGQMARICCLHPTPDTARQEAALTLARKAAKLNKDHPFFQLILGMAEYRSGRFAEADAALTAAKYHGTYGTGAFYRAMSLYRLGKQDQARKVMIAAAARMNTLPKDEQNPVLNFFYDDGLFLWLAYKEAQTLFKIDLSKRELLGLVLDDEVKTLGADHQSTINTTQMLAQECMTSGRPLEAVALLAKASAARPKDTGLFLKAAALQAWFEQGKEFAATRKRILASAKGNNEARLAESAAKACSILPSADKAELDAALALGRTAVKLGKAEWMQVWALLAQGMAECRSGNYAAADKALLAAEKAGSNYHPVPAISAFYRAMSLFRQGKKEEARKLALAAAAKMKPLPTDEKNPLAGNASHDDLILWLAYKEAKAMMKFDAASSPKAGNDTK